MKKFSLAILTILLFFTSCENKIDFEKVSFPPIPYTDSLNFVSSIENSKIYCFDASTDTIVGKYYINSGFVYANLKSRNSPHVYIAIMNSIYKVDIASGKAIKITKNDLNIDTIRYYSSTEVMAPDVNFSGSTAIFSSNDDYRKVNNIAGNTDGFTFKGKDYVHNNTYEILYNLTDGTEITLPKRDVESTMAKDDSYKLLRTVIDENIITVIYQKDNDDPNYKVYYAFYKYFSLDNGIDLNDCEFITESNNLSYFWKYYNNGFYYHLNSRRVSKYDPVTKEIKTIDLIKTFDPIFDSGVTIGQDGSVVIGNALYCSLGNFKKAEKDMIVKVNLDDLSYKIIE